MNNKKSKIIDMYTNTDGKITARQIAERLNNEGVKVSYNYVCIVIRDYNNSITDNITDTITDSITNYNKTESDNYNTVISMLSEVITKLSQIEVIINNSYPCDTRTHAPAGLESSIEYNIQEKEIKNISSLTSTTGLYTNKANNKGETDEDENYNLGYDDEVVTTDGVTEIPQEENKNNLGGYEDIEPVTDGVRPTTQGEKRKEKRNYESVDATQWDKGDKTPKDERKRYWDSWNEFKKRFPKLSDEEREHYFKMYTKKAEKIYAGDRLGEIRDNLQRQFNYLSSRATANDTPKEQPKDEQWKPDPSTNIKIQDKELGVEGAIQLYIQQLANLVCCSPISKDADEKVKYFEYYLDRINRYADAQLGEGRASQLIGDLLKANFKTQGEKEQKQAV